MGSVNLNDFVAAVDEHAERWERAGVRWQIHRGPTLDKSAAWVDCRYGERLASLIVWTTGEAELDLAVLATGEAVNTHYDFHSRNDISTVLDSVTHYLSEPAAG
jgi:hypothetical protein